jgi:hypothetical protein
MHCRQKWESSASPGVRFLDTTASFPAALTRLLLHLQSTQLSAHIKWNGKALATLQLLASLNGGRLQRKLLLMKNIPLVALCALCVCGMTSFASDPSADNSIHATLSKVSAAELPDKAAKLVTQAQASDRKTKTIEVVNTAVAINPAAAPAIVRAIARAVKEMAPVAAAAAAADQPKQAGAIAKAAAMAVPPLAARIVATVCRAVPKAYREVAVIVAQTVHGSDKAVLAAVAGALPELKPSIAQVLAEYSGPVSVGQILDEAAKLSQGQSSSDQASR